MTTTTILVWTSAASAVRHSCQHGWRRVDLDTSTLTPEQRELLASRVVSDEGARYGRRESAARSYRSAEPPQYDVAPPTAEGLVAHLQAHLDAERAKIEKVAAEARGTIAAARTAPIGDLPIDGEALRVLDGYCAHYGLSETGLRTARHLAGTDEHGRVALADLGRLEDYRQHCAREREERAERKRQEQVEREAQKAERERQDAADRAKLREIVGEMAPEILPILDAGKARKADLGAAVVAWACQQLGLDPTCLTDVESTTEPEGLDPAEFRALTRMQELAQRLGDPTVEVEIVHDTSEETDSEGSLVTVTADVAGQRVYLELPIEHVPLG